MFKKLLYSFKLIFKLNPLSLVLIFTFAIISAICSAVLLVYIKALTASLTASSSLNTFVQTNMLNLTIAGLCFLLTVSVSKYQSVYCEKAALKINKKINASILSKAEKLYGLQHLKDRQYFVTIEKLNMGDFVIENYLISFSPLIALIVNTICISLLFNFITPVLLGVLIAANIPSFFIRKKVAKIKQEEIEKGNIPSSALEYYFRKSLDAAAAKDFRLFAFTGLFLKKIDTCFSELKNLRMNSISKTSRWNLLNLLIKLICTAGIFFLFFKSIISAEMSTGAIMMIVVVLFQLSSNISGIGSFWAYLQKELDYFYNYKYFLSLQTIQNGKLIFNEPVSSIEFKSVSFGYDSRMVLENLSFKIDSKKVFALVGENGAGKSTIVKLLLRFIEPISGEILINGIPIKEFEIESYRNAISVIFQNFMRYGLSAKDNIFANQDISKYNNIDSILSSPFFKKLPNQENTQLNMGFGGYDISGGEWQRIAVMRALSKPYSLFIADEPTANIDPIEEYNIFQTIIKKTKGIRLIITHRMGSIKNCDEIFVLRNGKIEISGPHSEIMQKSEYYASLYNSQKSMYTHIEKGEANEN